MIRTGVISLAALLLAVLTSVQAVAIWGQCGGIGYSGPANCDSGLTCVVLNPYYFQCVVDGPTTTTTNPVTSTTSTTSTTKTTPTTSTTTTTSPPSSTTSSKPLPAGTRYWFSFGDSYTQTGFNITGTKPAAANPLGNPAYPGYTACGSFANWIDLASTLTLYKQNNQILTYNFAYGGATIDANLVTPYEPTVLSMTDQVNSFLSTVGTKPSYAPWTSANSVFSFFIGINDIGNSYYLSGDRSAFSDTLLDAYFALVHQVYDRGGRNFLFFTVPCVDRSPLMIAQGASAQAAEKSVIDTFNIKLAARITAFKAANAGVATYICDANAQLVAMLNSPRTWGFSDATSYGSDGGEMWCNNYHVSPDVHNYFAQGATTLLHYGGFLP